MAEKDTLKEKVAKHFKSASNANQKAIKGKARHEFNAVSGAHLTKVKGKAQNAFNVAASLQEKQKNTGKRDNTETLSKKDGPEVAPEMKAQAQHIVEESRKKKGADIHKKALHEKTKPPSRDPSP